MKYFVADAFAEKVFEGNPAGVCIMKEWIPIELMEKIAAENNLSETAFAVKEGNTYGLRWFTPAGEIDLCGHATLSTSHILFNYFETDCEEIHFHTKQKGYQLLVRRTADMIEMDFPVISPERYELSDYMTEALGAIPKEVYKTERDLIFLFDSEETVKKLNPDFSKLKDFPIGLNAFVTAKSDGVDFDFVLRTFWPKININEDPVTGAAFCCLVPLWKWQLGKIKMVARQVSARGGTVHCEYSDSHIKISGKCAMYLEGEINIS